MLNQHLRHLLTGTSALFLLCASLVSAHAITSSPSVIALDDGTGNHAIYA
jgi:hypothetical protein